MKVAWVLLFMALNARDPFHACDQKTTVFNAVRVCGVCITDDVKTAICTTSDGELIDLDEGDLFSGYKLINIDEKKVVFQDQATGKTYPIALTQ